jgi:HSP20 family protein
MTALVESYADWLSDMNRLARSPREAAHFLPPADVLAHDDGATVSMDLPGLRAEDVEIELENETLTVRGERPWPYGDDNATPRRVERAFGAFERSMRVPQGVDPDSVSAAMHDGVLELRIPKPETLKPHRIQVQAASDEEGRPTVIEGTATEGGAAGEGAAAT